MTEAGKVLTYRGKVLSHGRNFRPHFSMKLQNLPGQAIDFLGQLFEPAQWRLQAFYTAINRLRHHIDVQSVARLA